MVNPRAFGGGLLILIGGKSIYIITFFILDNNIIIMEILLCLKRPAIHHSLYSLFGFAGAGVRQNSGFGL